MFDKVVSVGIKPRHIAKILEISRVTASQWLNHHTEPHPLLKNKVRRFLESVDKAVADNKLPPPLHYRGQEENTYICATVSEYMKSDLLR